MNYYRYPTGSPVPAGRVTRTLVDWTPGWQAMPSSLTVSSGTATILPPSSSTGQLQLSGSASKLELQTSSDLAMADFAELTLTVEGLYTNSQTNMAPSLNIYSGGTTYGVAFYANDADTTAKFWLGQPSGTPVTVYSQYVLYGAERLNHRNLTLQVRPGTGEVRVLADDQVVAELPVSYRTSVYSGTARFCLVSSTTSTSQAMYCSRFTVTATHS